jgi:hypothetical protein
MALKAFLNQKLGERLFGHHETFSSSKKYAPYKANRFFHSFAEGAEKGHPEFATV